MGPDPKFKVSMNSLNLKHASIFMLLLIQSILIAVIATAPRLITQFKGAVKPSTLLPICLLLGSSRENENRSFLPF